MIDERNEVLAGNGVVAGAAAAGLTKLRIIDGDADTIIAVRRRDLSPDQKRDLAMYDNRSGELAEWNPEQLQADRLAGLDLSPFWTAAELAELDIDAMAGGDVRDVLAEEGAESPDREHQTFSCPLTVAQERTVRAALRLARQVFDVTTTADALTGALDAWAKAHVAAPAAPPKAARKRN